MQLSKKALSEIQALVASSTPDYPLAYSIMISDIDSQVKKGTLTLTSDDKDVLRWLNIAEQVNSGATTDAAVGVRLNNEIADLLENNTNISLFGPEEQASSNAVANSFFSRVINDSGVIPPFSGPKKDAIMFIDAQAGLGNLNLGPEAWAGAIPNALDPSYWTGFQNDNYYASLDTGEKAESVLIHLVTGAILLTYEADEKIALSSYSIDEMVNYLTGMEKQLTSEFKTVQEEILDGSKNVEKEAQTIYTNVAKLFSGTESDQKALSAASADDSKLFGTIDNVPLGLGTYDIGPGLDISNIGSSTSSGPTITSYFTNGGESSETAASDFSYLGFVGSVTDESGSASASGTLEILGSTTIISDVILSGVTINSFADGSDVGLSFNSSDGIVFADFYNDIYSDPGDLGESAIANPDGSVSIVRNTSSGSSESIITYTSGQIVDDQIANFNYDQIEEGGLEFNVLSQNGQTVISDVVAVLNGGSVELEPPVYIDDVDLIFSGSSGILKLDTPFYPYRSLENFQAGDTIDLVGLQTDINNLNGPTINNEDFYFLDVTEIAGSLSIEILNSYVTYSTGTDGNTIKTHMTVVADAQSIALPSYLGYQPTSVYTASDGAGGIDVFTSSRSDESSPEQQLGAESDSYSPQINGSSSSYAESTNLDQRGSGSTVAISAVVGTLSATAPAVSSAKMTFVTPGDAIAASLPANGAHFWAWNEPTLLLDWQLDHPLNQGIMSALHKSFFLSGITSKAVPSLMKTGAASFASSAGVARSMVTAETISLRDAVLGSIGAQGC